MPPCAAVVLAAAAVAGAGLAAPAAAAAQATPHGVTPLVVHWEDADWGPPTDRPGFPAGLRNAPLATDPDTGAPTYLARFPAGSTFAPHWHTYTETVVVLDGAVDIEMDGVRSTAAAGSYVIIPARAPHAWFTHADADAILLARRDGPADFHFVDPPPAFTMRVVATGLDFPWDVTWGPDDQLWITERAGKRIIRVNPATGARTVALELPAAYQAVLQDGVLGLALHPDLLAGAGRDFVYVAWTYDDAGPRGGAPDPRLRIQRYTWNARRARLEDPVDLIAGLPAHDDHLGGRLALGPDRTLYLAIGDQGGNWQRNRCTPIRSQVLPTAAAVTAGDWSTYDGKILRLNLDGSIPDDNPVIAGVRSHVFSFGHRNPQGLVFDADGQLFAAEHGPSTDDEVNRIEAGRSYGWPEVAGYRDDRAYAYANWSASSPTPCADLPNTRQPPASVPAQRERDWDDPRFRPPLATFFTVDDDYDFAARGAATAAASGLDLYAHPDGVPGWADALLLASLTRGAIYRIPLNADHTQAAGAPTMEFRSTNRYRDLAIRPDGKAFYVVTDNVGPTRDADGARTRTLTHPGALLEFTYREE